MTDIRFDIENFIDVKQGESDINKLSELLEQESRRYSRELEQESEARIR